MSRTLMAIVFAIAALWPLTSHAAKKMEADAYLKSFEYRSMTNKAFLKSVKKIIGDDKEAAQYFNMARTSSRESYEHFSAGDYGFALEDLGESNQLAMHALIIATNKDDPAIQEYVIKEEILLQARHDRERKEELLRKGIAEVETFIKTAERLSKDGGTDESEKMLGSAREHYDTSQLNLANQNFDEALVEIKKAYQLATQTVKDIKRAQDDIITFPKPAFNDENEILAYELKKNSSYVFFASKVVKEEDTEPQKMLKEAAEIKKKALAAQEADRTHDAIKELQESTELLIKAIKSAYKEK